jgi:15-cis-phytoene synthase
MSAERDDIEQAVASSDPDRMAAAFFAPAAMRPDLMALYAFNIELTRVRETVREPLAGQMRFAWWRDQLNRIDGGKALDAPVGRALAETVRRHNLPLELLQGLIDARGQELSEAPFATEAEFDAHAQATSSAIMKLAARICGAGNKADAVAGPAGLAYALTGTARSLAFEARHRRCFLPLSALSKAGIGPEDVFAGDMARLRPVVHALAARAMAAIREARRFAIPSGAAAAILPAVLARQYVPLLSAANVDVFAAPLQLGRLTTAAALARAAWTGRV